MLRKREIMAGLFVLASTYPEVSHADKYQCIRDCLDRTQNCNHVCYKRYHDDSKKAEVCANNCMDTGGKCVNGCDKYGKNLIKKK